MGIFAVNEIVDDILKTQEEDKVTEVKSTTLLNTEIGVEEIVQQISGYRWTVDYYNIIADQEDLSTDVDTSLDLGVNEYKKIKNLIIYVDSPLPNEIPEDITGNGTITVNIVPKYGDVIAAKLADGRITLFTLTAVNRKTYNIYSVYDIEYRLYKIINRSDDVDFQTLEAKVVEVLYYNPNYLMDNTKPLLTDKEITDLRKIKSVIANLIRYYNSKFITMSAHYQMSVNSTVANYENDIYYDPYLEWFYLNLLGMENLPEKFNYIGLKKDYEYSFLDMILLSDLDSFLIKEYLTLQYEESPNIFLNPLIYRTNKMFKLTDDEEVANNTLDIVLNRGIEDEVVCGLHTHTYLFSPDFYSVLKNTKTLDEVNISLIEQLVLKLINDEPIEITDIDLVKSRVLTDVWEKQFFFLPIVISLYLYYVSKMRY